MEDVKDTAVALRAEVVTWPDRARALTVTNQPEYEAAGELLGAIKGLRAKISATFDPIVDAANRTHKEALARKKEHETPLVEAEGIIKRMAGDYVARVQAERAAEQRRLEAQARERAEELRLQRALELEAAGDKEEASAIIEEPIAVVRVQPSAPAPKAAGLSAVERWSAIVKDKRALIAHVAAHPELGAFLDVNMPALNALARTQKEALSIPGVQAVKETGISARASQW